MNILPFLNRHKHKEPPNTESGFKGVYYHKYSKQRPWKAYIRNHGQYICLGYYETKEEAALAYNQAAERYKGKDTFLNPIFS